MFVLLHSTAPCSVGLELFDISASFDLNIMKENQNLTQVTTAVLEGLMPILRELRPDRVLVHGDTTTTFAGALAAFYAKIPVGHVETGLGLVIYRRHGRRN